MKTRVSPMLFAVCLISVMSFGATITHAQLPQNVQVDKNPRINPDALKNPRIPRLAMTTLLVQTQTEIAPQGNQPSKPGEIVLFPNGQKEKWETSYGASIASGSTPADLAKLTATMKFRWNAAAMKDTGGKKVKIAYQFLKSAVPYTTDWQSATDVIGSGTLDTSLGNPPSSGTFNLDNAVWKGVNWSQATPDPGQEGLCTVYVRVIPMAGNQEVAPPSGCVKLVFRRMPIIH